MIAIRFDQCGGPEMLRVCDQTLAAPGPGEVRLRHTAIGLNFIDTYHRSGLYPVALPSGLGLEAAGIIEAVGTGVALTPGSRVGYCWGPIGAYASHRLIAADRLVALPANVSDDVAAAVLLKGCTAEFLIERCARVAAGDWVLVHAAAGGVGQLLVQWLAHLGARVIAVAGSAEKVALAMALGAEHGLVQSGDVPAAVRALTAGAGVRVVFDGVGRDTWAISLDCLGRRGLQISYGNASGPVGAFDLRVLAQKGSLYASRPTLFDYYTSREEIDRHAGRVLDLVARGVLRVDIGQRYALADAASAHADLEARRTVGSTVLVP